MAQGPRLEQNGGRFLIDFRVMSGDRRVGSTMAWDRVGRVVICVSAGASIDQQDWVDFIRWARTGSVPVKDSVALVHSFGGGPNALQRGMLTDMFAAEDAKPRTSILTDSAVVRGFGIALSWFNPQIRVWSPEKIEQAFDHLGLDKHERSEGTQVLDELGAAVQGKTWLHSP